MKMNEIYEAPLLEVLNVTVEKGFEGSIIEGPDFDDNGSGGVDF